MAIRPSSQVNVRSKYLGEDDLGDLHIALYPIRIKYKPFGLNIGVKITDIKAIEEQYRNPGERLLEVLLARLNDTPPLTWSTIDTALRMQNVGESKLAESLQSSMPEHGSSSEASKKSLALFENEEVDEVIEGQRKVYAQDNVLDSKRQVPFEMSLRSKGKCSESDNVSCTAKNGVKQKILTKRQRTKHTQQQKRKSKKGKFDKKHKEKFVDSSTDLDIVSSCHDLKARRESKCYSKTVLESDLRDRRTAVQREKNATESKQFDEMSALTHKNEKAESITEESSSCSTSDDEEFGNSPTEERHVLKSSCAKTNEKNINPGICYTKHSKYSYKGKSKYERKRKISQPRQSSSVQEQSSDDDCNITGQARRMGHHNIVKHDTYSSPCRSKTSAGISAEHYSGCISSGSSSSRELEQQLIPPKKKRRNRSLYPMRHYCSRSSSESEVGIKHPVTHFEKESKHNDEEKESEIEMQQGSKQVRTWEESSVSSLDTTDTSSPENEPPSEEERKKLRKVFKCFFGRLCYRIKNPNSTAAELQAKGLISRKMMEIILTSPKTIQENAIALVHALEKRIWAHSIIIFKVIQVFLEDKHLHETGREMWINTGELCPDLTAKVLGSEKPPSLNMTQDFGIGREKTSVAVRSYPQTHTPPYHETGIEAIHQQRVSLPQAQLGSFVLIEYKRYLQSIYDARGLAAADYLPTLDSPYINLAMIKSQRYKDPSEKDEFTKLTLHGGVDQILQSKVPIDIKDLLTPDGSSSNDSHIAHSFPSNANIGECVRFVLVEGPPGIGKSTFAWEVCRRWDKMESLRNYHTVVLLRLREKWVLKATSLSDLFRYPYKPEFSKKIAHELHELQGKDLLLMLDGFDEVSHSFNENSVIKSILCKELLPKCTIILTTRPSARHTLLKICKPHIDKHIEIIGFREEDRVRYITNFFCKTPELQVNFLKYMFLIPHIKSMMYVPLNCSIIAQVYYESQNSHHIIPRTRTQLYKALTHSVLAKYVAMNKSCYKCSATFPENLDKEDMENFLMLAKFAFNSYHDPERKVTFFKEDIPDGLVHFGFMNESTEMYASKGVERTFSFIHLTLQEYLAAWHVANTYSTQFQIDYHFLALKQNDKYKVQSSMRWSSDDDASDDSSLACDEEIGIPFGVHERDFSNSSSSSSRVAAFYSSSSSDEVLDMNSLTECGENSLILRLKSLHSYLVEPAIFLAGITGWIPQPKDDRNCWKKYVQYDTAAIIDPTVLLQSLYEAQNPALLSYYFISEKKYTLAQLKRPSITTFTYVIVPSKRNILSISSKMKPYECYALSYCVSHSCCHQFRLILYLNSNDDISCLEVFIVGLKNHRESKSSRIHHLSILLGFSSLESSKKCISWLLKAPFLPELTTITISSNYETSKYPLYPFMNHIDALCKYQITELQLDNIITRETMLGVKKVLLNCPSLVKLTISKATLGYDGILFICNALRRNISLKHILIHDNEMPNFASKITWDSSKICCFRSSLIKESLPNKTTCTELLLELDMILKSNTVLTTIDIQSGQFCPFFMDGERKWTELGYYLAFNLGTISRGVSPNLRRSFSSSNLRQPRTHPVCVANLPSSSHQTRNIDFKKLFLKRKRKSKKFLSFTAPDITVMQSFSGIDPRLKECLGISHLDCYLDHVIQTCSGMLQKVAVQYQLYHH